jgi:signal transduction histidine kinase/CheY-like chemotaxis protein/HPt (histidine-containing phosphotransfer) domain-containing protein
MKPWTTNPSAVSIWTVEFIDRKKERLFQDSRWEERSRQNRFAAAVWALATLAAAFSFEQAELLSSPTVELGLAFHFFAAVLTWLISRRPQYHPLYEWVAGLLIVSATAVLAFLMITGSAGFSTAVATFVILPLVITIGFDLRTWVAWAGCLACLLGFSSVSRLRIDLTEVIQPLWLQIIISIGVGITIHRLINSSRRSSFLTLETEQTLNKELSQAMIELETAHHQAEAANRAKSDFLASMSHEIRTPMNGVLGMASLMLKNGALPPEEKKRLGVIHDSARSLLTLLNDLLDMSAVEAGRLRLNPAPFQPEALAGQALDVVRPLAEEKELRLLLHVREGVPFWVMGDGTRVRQVLINLLSNAVKFSKEGTVGLEVRKGEGLEFVVTDCGPGISDEEKKHIFERFYHGQSADGSVLGGAGLGLAICREIAVAMGGSIMVEDHRPAGTTFRVRLPLAEVASPAASSSTPSPRLEARQNALILFAEDNRMNQLVGIEMLRSLGFNRIESVPNGKEAADRCRETAFDLVLMDCAMPVLDGWDATRAIRSGGHADLPIVAMTAYASEADREKCREAGMNDFLAKPLQEEELIRVLNQWLPLRRAEKKVLDREGALAQMAGRQDVLRRAAGMALEDIPAILGNIQQALECGNFSGVRAASHKLIGSASTLHAAKLESLAVELHDAAAAGRLHEAAEICPRVNKAWIELEKELGALV